MGCGVSKPEGGVDSAAAGRPLYRRFDDIRRLRLGGARPRKDSTVSNVGLLNPEEEEDESAGCSTEEASTGEITCHYSVCSACGSRLSHPAENSEPNLQLLPPPETAAEKVTPQETSTRCAEENESELDKLIEVCVGETVKKSNKVEEKDTEEERGAALVCSGGLGLISNEEEIPGSPSFRVYFVRAATEEESQDHGITSLGKTGESMDSSSTEEREAKTSTKSKGSRFRGLTRRHSAVHVLLNVRSCYDHSHADDSACRDHSSS